MLTLLNIIAVLFRFKVKGYFSFQRFLLKFNILKKIKFSLKFINTFNNFEHEYNTFQLYQKNYVYEWFFHMFVYPPHVCLVPKEEREMHQNLKD